MSQEINLRKYKKNYFTQFGEDGIIEKIFRIITPSQTLFCVEFGAWNGVHFSNTRNLLKNKGWSGALIEPNKNRYAELLTNYGANKKVVCLNKFIGLKGRDSLDNILKKAHAPVEFDLLSIDIDGNDYYIWESLKLFRPKVVVVEFNPTVPHNLEYVQPKDFTLNQGSSLLSLTNLAKLKKYELVATTDINAFYVAKEYFPLFKIKDNSLAALHDNSKYLTQLFQLYDGTLVLTGCKELLWHRIKFSSDGIQILPKFLRKFPDKYNIVLTKLYKRDFSELIRIIRNK